MGYWYFEYPYVALPPHAFGYIILADFVTCVVTVANGAILSPDTVDRVDHFIIRQ